MHLNIIKDKIRKTKTNEQVIHLQPAIPHLQGPENTLITIPIIFSLKTEPSSSQHLSEMQSVAQTWPGGATLQLAWHPSDFWCESSSRKTEEGAEIASSPPPCLYILPAVGRVLTQAPNERTINKLKGRHDVFLRTKRWGHVGSAVRSACLSAKLSAFSIFQTFYPGIFNLI